MTDWWNWVRLLIIIPSVINAAVKTYRDLPKGHVGRFWMMYAAAFYVLLMGKEVWEDAAS